MTVIKMSSFGRILTGREYGVNVAKKIASESIPPLVFDFSGVLSVGSSFGDEIFKAVIAFGPDRIKIQNVNNVVRAALNQVQEDLGIKIEFS